MTDGLQQLLHLAFPRDVSAVYLSRPGTFAAPRGSGSPRQSSKTLEFHLPCGWLLTHRDGGTWGLRFSMNCVSVKGIGADSKGLNPPGVTLPTTSKMICFHVLNTFSSLTTTNVQNLRDPLNSQTFYAGEARFCYCITRERAL